MNTKRRPQLFKRELERDIGRDLADATRESSEFFEFDDRYDDSWDYFDDVSGYDPDPYDDYYDPINPHFWRP